MQRLSVNPALALSLVLWISGANGDEDGSGPQRQRGGANQAEDLVRSGLAAGLLGDAEGRRTKLDAAMAADPDSSAPRWHLGHVRVGDAWKTIAEAEELARADKKLSAYVQQRAKYAGSLDGEARLAAWCQRNGLVQQSLAHWHQVLRYQADDRRALRALDAHWYGGRLLANEDVKRQREYEEDYRRRLITIKLKVDVWRRGLEDDSKREAVLDELRMLRGELAVIIISDVLLRPIKGQVRPTELRAEAMRILGGLDDPQSAPILAWHAAMSPDDLVREAARKQLLGKPLHDFAPVLLAGLSMPVEVASVNQLQRQGVATQYTLEQEGPAGRQQQSRRTTFQGIRSPRYVPISYQLVTKVL